MRSADLIFDSKVDAFFVHPLKFLSYSPCVTINEVLDLVGGYLLFAPGEGESQWEKR
jgi:hypothetical protein